MHLRLYKVQADAVAVFFTEVNGTTRSDSIPGRSDAVLKKNLQLTTKTRVKGAKRLQTISL